MTDVTREMVLSIQELHKRNLNLSASTIGERLGLQISPVTIVKVIEGQYNYILEKDE
jgi:hypothetical protein